MEETAFLPASPLEDLLVAASSGPKEREAFLRALLGATLHVPSASAVAHDGDGFVPLLVDDKDKGETFIAVYTSRERAFMHSNLAPYSLTIEGASFFGWVPEGYGVVVNPGFTAALQIPPQGVKDAYRKLAANR